MPGHWETSPGMDSLGGAQFECLPRTSRKRPQISPDRQGKHQHANLPSASERGRVAQTQGHQRVPREREK